MNSPTNKYLSTSKRAPQWLRYSSLLLIILTFFLPSLGNAAPPTEKQKIKAALIYKIPKFVKWPNRTFEKNGHFNICMLGKDTLNGALNALKNRKISQKRIDINYIKLEDLNSSHCHVLFVTFSQNKNLSRILNTLNNQPTLTISDINKFATNGGMIEIYKQDKRLAFRINNKAAKAANLELAAPLLDMATVVEK